MKGYGQFCPVAKATEVVAERWTPLILRELLSGSMRFNDLQRGVPLMSRGLLSKRLKELERAGVVERKPQASGRGHEYHLTAAGEELRPIIEQLGAWGQRWVGSPVSEDDLDPRLLMWDMRRGIDVERLPGHRVVVAFVFTDVPQAALRRIWLVLERPEVDVCYKDPGFPVDLVVHTSVHALVRVWMGHATWAELAEAGEITTEGAPRLREAFPGWLKLSLFASVQRATDGPRTELAPAPAARA